MLKPTFLLLSFIALGSCASGPTSPPSRISDACSIISERPGWLTAMLATEAKWGVPMTVQMATMYRESKFVGDARTPRRYTFGIIPAGRMSSAYGFAQAIDGTWDWYKSDTGNRRAKRDDFADASDFIGWYMSISNRKNGIAFDDPYRQYLAYHEGHGGYARGSYNKKSFLRRAAAEVRDMEARYRTQLTTCS